MTTSPRITLAQALANEKPLQIMGVINAYAARLADQVGFKALYLSGAGVANSHYALPDLALTSLNDVLSDVEQITSASNLPLLVDADTGWGSPLNVSRAFKALARAGARGAHIEDQTESKRCGHREGKRLISTQHMVGKIKAALDGRADDNFMVMARTDALEVVGEEKTLARARAYQEAGADALFLEAVTDIKQYQRFCQALHIPVLANITEFGKTPLFTRDELAQVGVSMVLYPLSAFRAMNAAALNVFQTIRTEGTQQGIIDTMQTRRDLYHYLNYDQYEQTLDKYLQLMEHDHGSN